MDPEKFYFGGGRSEGCLCLPEGSEPISVILQRKFNFEFFKGGWGVSRPPSSPPSHLDLCMLDHHNKAIVYL